MALWDITYRLRSVIVILFCLLGFALGALYLSVERLSVDDILVVTGNDVFAPERPAVLRLTAVRRADKHILPVVVRDVRRTDGAPTPPWETRGRRPVVLDLQVPENAPDPLPLEVDVTVGDGAARTVSLPLSIDAQLSSESRSVSRDLRRGGELQVVPVPQDGVLVHGLDNVLYVAVTEKDGTPVTAEVRLRFGKGPARVATTDSLGLASFPIEGGRPRYEMRFEANAGDGRSGWAELDIAPAPRGLRLRSRPASPTSGSTIRVELESVEPSGLIHCDLVDEGLFLASFPMRLDKGTADEELILPSTQGSCELQCSAYYQNPGRAFATRAVPVSPSEPDRALLGLLSDVESPWGPAYAISLIRMRLFAEASPAQRELATAFILALATPPYRSSSLLYSSLDDDQAVLDADRDAFRGRLLAILGAALALLLIWAIGLVATNMKEMRRRSALLDDDGEAILDEAPGQGGFGRHRGIVQLLIIIGLLVTDVLAFLWLLELVGR